MKPQKKQSVQAAAFGRAAKAADSTIGRRDARAPGSAAAARLRLRITAAAETQLRAGHPWVYGESVREQNRQGAAGELAVIYDRKDTFLAVGLFDPDSPI